MKRRGWGSGLLVLILGVPCRAQDLPAPAGDPGFWRMPAQVEAYWAVGPAPLGGDPRREPTRALVESALRGLVVNSFEGPSRRTTALRSLLSSGILARQPYRAILLKVHAPETPDSAARAPLPPLDTLAAVLDLRDCPEPDKVAAIIAESAGRAGARETTERLPRGVLHRFRFEADADVTETSWLAAGPDLLIGFGNNAIPQYIATRDGDDPAAAAYRAAIDRSRPAGERVFEAFVNLDALRQDIPDEMGWGGAGRLIDAWGVANARGVMLTARLAHANPDPGRPAVLLLDLATDDRSEPFGRIRTEALNGAPATLSPDAGAGCALVLHADPAELIRRGIRTFEALSPSTPAQAQRRRNWLRDHDEDLRRLAAKLGPEILVQSSPDQPLLNLTVSIRSTAGLTGDLRAVLDSLAPTVSFDPGTQTWRLRLLPAEQDPDHAMQSFTFGLTPGGLVGAWEPAAVREALSPRRQP